MPTYRVKQKGFMDGQLYRPGDSRFGHITADKPIKPLPDWLELDEDFGKPRKGGKAKLTAAEKDAQNQAELTEANFIGDGKTTVVTL